MIKKILVYLMFTITIKSEIIHQNGCGFVNLNIVRVDSLYCNEKYQKLLINLNNIEVQLQIFKDQLTNLSEEKDKDLIIEINLKIESLMSLTDTVNCMYETMTEFRINEAIDEVMKLEGFSAILPLDKAIMVYPLYDITYKVINKMNMKYINKEEK